MAGVDEFTKLYIPLNEGTGGETACDDISDNHDGEESFVGTAQLSTAQTKFAGDSSSLLMDGNSDYIYYPDSPDWDVMKTADIFTVECQVRHTSSATANILSQKESATEYWTIQHRQGDGTWIGVYSGGRWIFHTGYAPNTNTGDWVHVAAVFNNGVIGLFLNGNQGAYTTYASSPTFAAALQVGDSAYNGHLSHVRVYNGNPLNATIAANNSGTCDVPTEAYTDDSLGAGGSALANILKLSKINKELKTSSVMG